MLKDLTASGTVTINGSVEKVWKGLTDPAIIKDYLFGTNTVTDWKAGSGIIFQGEYNGQTYKDKGVVLENIPNQRISYSYWSGFSGLEDKPENYSTVTYILKKVSDKETELTWAQKGFGSEEGYKHSQGGMKDFLQKVRQVIEK